MASHLKKATKDPGSTVDLAPFNNQVGISDILNWRECPARMEHGMRRHVVLDDGATDEPPGHTDWTNAYGSAVHGAIHLVETEQLSNEAAVDRVWPEFAGYLDPGDLALLKEDLDAYRGDTPPGMELVVAEKDVRVPLFVHNGVQIFFRFKLDALYRSVVEPTVFYHRDYKSSKHRRTQQDVDKDLQMWSYNWGIFTLWVECESLLQSYEQLRFNNLVTSKNREQRQQVKEWLIRTVKAMLADEEMKPKQNMFCPWCFPAGTLIVTDAGLLPIEAVEAGQSVLTGAGRLMPVTATRARSTRKALCEIVLSGGTETIRCTPEHKLLVTRLADIDYLDTERLPKSMRSEMPPPGFWRLRGTGSGRWLAPRGWRREWIEADALTAGDIVWGHLPPERPQTLTNEELRILGWYLAEGDAGARSVSFSLHVNEVAYQKDIETLLASLFGATRLERRITGNSYQVYLHDHHAAAWFRFFGGKGAANKRIHPVAFAPQTLMPLLLAAWQGDGHGPSSKSSQTSYTSSSRELVYQLQTILMGQGIAGRVAHREAGQYNNKAAQKLGFREAAYSLVLSGVAAQGLADFFDIRIKSQATYKAPSVALVGPWVAQAVITIEKESCAQGQKVYDLQVQTDESFVLAQQVVAHNCPLVITCDQTVRSTDYWKGRLAVLAPATKEGRKTTLALPEGKKLEEVIKDVLPRMIESRKTMQAVEKKLKELIEDLPLEKREELGWRLADRKSNTFSPEGLRIIHEALGARFYEVITLSKTAVETVVGKQVKGEPLPPVLQVIENVQLKKVSSTTIEPA